MFPYIIHDAGITSMKSNYFLFNSGLLFASRHPVLKVDFKCFSTSVAQCRFTSKGLLMVKVRIIPVHTCIGCEMPLLTMTLFACCLTFAESQSNIL